jgi:hypothetical protein
MAKGTKKPSEVVIDKGLRARWEEAVARYRKARAEETSGWDERYEALGEILDGDPPYYLAGGFKTARAFLQAEAADQDERTVRRYIRVARYFDPEDEAAHGIDKLDALLDYLEAAGDAPLAPAKISLSKQRIRVPDGSNRNGQSRLVSFGEVTREELREATRATKGHAGQLARTLPPLVKELRQVLAKANLGRIGVRLRDKKLDLSAIPPVQLGRLGKTLAKAKLLTAT